MGSYLRPTFLEDALAALAERPRSLLAGGTDHFPARATTSRDDDILDITALPGLRRIERHAEHWWLPCQATWTELIEAGLPAQFDALVQAARQVGGEQVQNAATVVGNLCNASPAADATPCLLALGAQVELASRAGRRNLAVEDFVLGPRLTARRADEMVLGLRIPRADDARSCFLKLGARRYLVISIVSVAASIVLDREGDVEQARIAVGACSPVARRLVALETELQASRGEAVVVRDEHLAGLAPIDDVRAGQDYRRTAALELVRRCLHGLISVPA